MQSVLKHVDYLLTMEEESFVHECTCIFIFNVEKIAYSNICMHNDPFSMVDK